MDDKKVTTIRSVVVLRRVYADFNAADGDRVPLDRIGSIFCLNEIANELAIGLRVVLDDGEVEARAKLAYSHTDDRWVGVLLEEVRVRFAAAPVPGPELVECAASHRSVEGVRVYADLPDAVPGSVITLDSIGSTYDLGHVTVSPGQRITLYDEFLDAQAIVSRTGGEWRATVERAPTPAENSGRLPPLVATGWLPRVLLGMRSPPAPESG